jgi:hypothetical protein
MHALMQAKRSSAEAHLLAQVFLHASPSTVLPGLLLAVTTTVDEGDSELDAGGLAAVGAGFAVGPSAPPPDALPSVAVAEPVASGPAGWCSQVVPGPHVLDDVHGPHATAAQLAQHAVARSDRRAGGEVHGRVGR